MEDEILKKIDELSNRLSKLEQKMSAKVIDISGKYSDLTTNSENIFDDDTWEDEIEYLDEDELNNISGGECTNKSVPFVHNTLTTEYIDLSNYDAAFKDTTTYQNSDTTVAYGCTNALTDNGLKVRFQRANSYQGARLQISGGSKCENAGSILINAAVKSNGVQRNIKLKINIKEV